MTFVRSKTLPFWLAGSLLVLCVAAMYYGSAHLGLLLAFQKTNASSVWPPSGIAFAALLLLGYRVWPGVAIGAFLANIVVFLIKGVGSDLRSAKKSWDPNSGHECTLGVSTYAQTRKEVPDGKYAGSERVCDEIAEKYPPVGESVAVGAMRTGCISSGGGRTSSRFG